MTSLEVTDTSALAGFSKLVGESTVMLSLSEVGLNVAFESASLLSSHGFHIDMVLLFQELIQKIGQLMMKMTDHGAVVRRNGLEK